jgi:hypothetical protein
MSAEREERRLLERIRAGDREATEALVEKVLALPEELRFTVTASAESSGDERAAEFASLVERAGRLKPGKPRDQEQRWVRFKSLWGQVLT